MKIYYKFISEVIYICGAFGLDKDSFPLIKIDILLYTQLFTGTYNLFFFFLLQIVKIMRIPREILSKINLLPLNTTVVYNRQITIFH